MVENNRISLNVDMQHKWFKESMDVLRANKLNLTDYDARLFQGLEDGYSVAGRSMTMSRKQMEHIKQVAYDFERGS